MVRMNTIIIAVILSAATAKAQNYHPFLREAEQALANEFRPIGPHSTSRTRFPTRGRCSRPSS
jgi:hypothetical protein